VADLFEMIVIVRSR